MQRLRFSTFLSALLCIASWWSTGCRAAEDRTGQIVGQVIVPLLAANGIPGMAVGVIADGQSHVYDYGLASIAPRRPVTGNTLFEIGSISKTFNATLAAYAELQGDLRLTDMASADFPALRGTAFDRISLIDLGTHTPGGLPLQVPDGTNDNTELMAYFRAWKPAYAPGTMRTYSNPSIGLLGFIAAARMHQDYSTLLRTQMFPAMGLHHSFVILPADEIGNYAEGYGDDGNEVRLQMGVLGPEAYGIRMTAADLLHFVAINMGLVGPNGAWRQAVMLTHTGYFQLQAGAMIQDLIWEQYDMPVNLAMLQAGNSDQVLLQPNPVVPLTPPMPPRTDVLLNKTGSTNGFGAYVAFISADHVGVVLLANKRFPIPARVAAAYEILSRLDSNFKD